MLRFAQFIVWTGCAMALGVWMATVPVAGSTPLARLERIWNGSVGPNLQEKIQDAKDALSTARDQKPRERHSEQDRVAVNHLIAKHSAPK